MSLWNLSTFSPAASGAAAPMSVSVSTTMQTLITDNSNRKGATIWNFSNAPLCIDFGSSASKAVFVYRISAGGYYEIPFEYTRIVSGVWALLFFSNSIKRKYAAERDFGHIKTHLKDLVNNLEFLFKELDRRLDS